MEERKAELTKELNTLAAPVGGVETQAYREKYAMLKGLVRWAEDFNKLLHAEEQSIEISRDLITRKYSIEGMSANMPIFTDKFCRKVLSLMLYILYNDDFQDRPPSQIVIVKDESEASTWQSIFSRLFEEASTGYSLVEAATVEDQRKRDSIVSDAQAVLNKTLAKAWKSFHLDRNKKVKIRLTLTPFGEEEEAELSVSIVENIGENERFFEVVDRSKGFLWFYNFVMKTEFNPKNFINRSATVYLLDEPGSYLHSAAQSKLAEKLREISRKNGKVIYCTHSPHLLHPDSIPINDIHIVSKSNQKEISVERLPQYKTSTERLVALQPMLEALQINGQQFSGDGRPILSVEGIYDKYVVAMFVDEIGKYDILPGTSATSIVKNIQFLNAFGSKYLALWDNDPEGRREFKKAKDSYGVMESRRFLLLPSEEGKNCRMEDMFSGIDITFLKKLLSLNENASYESVMVTLFYADLGLKDTARSGLSLHSRNKFQQLKAMISERIREEYQVYE